MKEPYLTRAKAALWARVAEIADPTRGEFASSVGSVPRKEDQDRWTYRVSPHRATLAFRVLAQARSVFQDSSLAVNLRMTERTTVFPLVLRRTFFTNLYPFMINGAMHPDLKQLFERAPRATARALIMYYHLIK